MSLQAPDAALPPPVRLEEPGESTRSLQKALPLIFLGFLISGLVNPKSLGLLPLRFLLKDQLHLNAEGIAAFFAIGSFAWYLKPVAGLLSDRVRLRGTRRRHYLLFSTAMAAVGWLLMAVAPRTFSGLLVGFLALDAMLVIFSTVLGGFLVEEGRRHAATGRLSAWRTAAMSLSSLIVGPAGGYLAGRAFGVTAGVCVGLLLILFVLVLAFVQERPLTPEETRQENDRRREHLPMAQMRAIGGSQPLWSAGGMIFLIYVMPGFLTPLFVYQTDTLHFSAQFIGSLSVISGALGLAGGFFYMLLCRRFSLRIMLALSIAASAVAALLFLAYRSHGAALWIEGINGFSTALVTLAVFDLAARGTPKGSESLVYSLLMSLNNLAISLSDVLGSWLFSHLHLSFISLVWINALTTTATLAVLPLLPCALMDRRDGEAEPQTSP